VRASLASAVHSSESMMAAATDGRVRQVSGRRRAYRCDWSRRMPSKYVLIPPSRFLLGGSGFVFDVDLS
jgi:hypothetical protein